jgi:nicotinamide-nucleotide amidase
MASQLARSTSVALTQDAKLRNDKKLFQLAKLDIISFQTILDKLNYQSHAAAGELLVRLVNFGINIVTVESLTAGKIASTLIDIPSYASGVYGGFVVYDTDAKREFVDVTTKSVYSQKCARQMAEGALKNSRAMCALAVTGHAGGFDDTDGEYLGYVDMGFSYRNGENTFKTATKRLKFCDLKDIKPSCDEYKKRLNLLHNVLPSMVKDAKLQEPFKGQLQSIKDELSPRGTPFSDDLYQMRIIIRTACVIEACLFAIDELEKINNKDFFKSFEKMIFTAKPRDTDLKNCQEPSRTIRKYIKDDVGVFSDDEYNKIAWATKFGDTGDERDDKYDASCNQDDFPSSRPAINTRTSNSTVPSRQLSRFSNRRTRGNRNTRRNIITSSV